MLGEPPHTAYDLRFRVAGIPVRVHPLFWLVSVVLGANYRDQKLVLLWVGVVFVSILVHELGHAMTARFFGWEPHITLYAMGGLASYRMTRYRPDARMAVIAAGPLAGFLLAGLVVVALFASGMSVEVTPWLEVTPVGEFSNPYLAQLVMMLLFVNIYWGLVNCLPVWPLDGGQFTGQVLQRLKLPGAQLITFQISLVTAALIAVAALLFTRDWFIALMFGFLAYNSYTAMRQFQDGGYGS